jgi:hypothetical protein
MIPSPLSLTSPPSNFFSNMIPLSKTIEPFSLCLIGLWSNNGKPVILLVEDLPIRKALILQAFLIRIREGMIYTTQLRRFLLIHPLLVIELDFHLEEDPTAPYGFDVEKTLPSDFWLREKLRGFDRALLQALLQATVRDLQREIPGLGETVAFDVKHIYAWVKENNERASVKNRYDKTKQLAGDPDCKLGVKRSTNQEQPDGSRSEKN